MRVQARETFDVLAQQRPKLTFESLVRLCTVLFVDPKAAAARRSATGTDKTRQYEVWRVYLSVRLPSLHKHFLHYNLLEPL